MGTKMVGQGIVQDNLTVQRNPPAAVLREEAWQCCARGEGGGPKRTSSGKRIEGYKTPQPNGEFEGETSPTMHLRRRHDKRMTGGSNAESYGRAPPVPPVRCPLPAALSAARHGRMGSARGAAGRELPRIADLDDVDRLGARQGRAA